MAIRVVADEKQPSAVIEIPLEKPLPQYGLEQPDRPTPREVDAILASDGFRELIEDARTAMMDLLAQLPFESGSKQINFGSETPAFEVKQFAGAICPAGDAVYRPALWIVLRDSHAKRTDAMSHAAQESVASIARELVKKLHLT